MDLPFFQEVLGELQREESRNQLLADCWHILAGLITMKKLLKGF